MLTKMNSQLGDIMWPTLITVMLLLLWEILVRALGIRSILLPAPSEIAMTMVRQKDLIVRHLWPSLYMTIAGFVLSVVGGMLVAVLITYSEVLRKGLYPVIVVSQVIPQNRDRAAFHRLVRNGRNVQPAACSLDCVFSHGDQFSDGIFIDRSGHSPHGSDLYGATLADLLENPHAPCTALHIRRHEDLDHTGNHRRHRLGVRRFARGHWISDQNGGWSPRYAIDDGRDHGAQHQRPRFVRIDRARRALRHILECGERRREVTLLVRTGMYDYEATVLS